MRILHRQPELRWPVPGGRSISTGWGWLSPGGLAVEALTQGFRKRFSIPEEAPTIADRILQKRHHDWIEAFLVQHQTSRTAETLG